MDYNLKSLLKKPAERNFSGIWYILLAKFIYFISVSIATFSLLLQIDPSSGSIFPKIDFVKLATVYSVIQICLLFPLMVFIYKKENNKKILQEDGGELRKIGFFQQLGLIIKQRDGIKTYSLNLILGLFSVAFIQVILIITEKAASKLSFFAEVLEQYKKFFQF